jgi:membrane protease YdiL (CAAX protease family)
MSAPTSSRWEAFSIAVAITVAAMALRTCAPVVALWDHAHPYRTYVFVALDGTREVQLEPNPEPRWHFPTWLTFERYADSVMLLFGLVLTLPRPKASGLCVGNIQDHWQKLLVLISVPLLLMVLVYPQLSERPFANSDLSMWLISPLAQDLVFGGAIYRILRPHFSGSIHPKLPMEWVLPVGGLFFAAWHLQNLTSMSMGYVAFQLLYTWAAYTFVGLTRQWTGSLFYVTFAHMLGNFIVWCVR